MTLKIGIQGDKCSANERACKFFAEKYHWDDFKIKYCISTERVLSALDSGRVDYGTFAQKSLRAGTVDETEEAIKKHSCTKIDEIDLKMDHALFCNSKIDKYERVRIISHPQALKEHMPFLEREFSCFELVTELCPATAAKKLHQNKYPNNSLIIASIKCAQIYGLNVFMDDLPTNEGYVTTICLVKK